MGVKKVKQDEQTTMGPIVEPNEIYNPNEYCPICGKHVSEKCEHIEQINEEVQKEMNKEVEEKLDDMVMQTFNEMENKPSEAQIQEWKNKYGQIYVTVLDKDVAVVYRKIKRGEYKALLSRNLQNIDLENEIFALGVLWPRELTVLTFDAGVVSTISNMILKMSGFVSEQEALMLTREL